MVTHDFPMRFDMIGNLEMSWTRDKSGYRIEQEPGAKFFIYREEYPTLVTPGFSIMPCSGDIETYRPLEMDNIYCMLAEIPYTPEGALKFVNAFGLPSDSKEANGGFPLSEIFEASDSMSYCIELKQKKDWPALVSLLKPTSYRDGFTHVPEAHHGLFSGSGETVISLRLKPGDQTPTLEITPRNLWAAIWLQFAADLSSGSTLRPCDHCNEWIKQGGTDGAKSTKRYCSAKCQNAAAYARRKVTAK
jgi:hypothetical protein